MGLLDSVIGAVGGNTQGAQQGALIQHVTAMLGNNSSTGGLNGLVQSFEGSGLGHIIGSWVGTGQNLPISADQVQQALGSGKIEQIAQSLGLQSDQVSAQLSQILPQLVNHVTPNGQIPADGVAHTDIATALSGILGRLSGGNAPSPPK